MPGPAAPPPPPPGSRQGWLSPPPDIQLPPINPDAADDPWASWYGKPRTSRDESPSATLPRVTPPPGGRPSQQYDAQGYSQQYDAQGYSDGTGYVPAPPYVAPQQAGGPWGGPPPYDGAQPGPGEQYGDQFSGGPPYGATQQLGPGQSYGPGQQYPGQPAGSGFGGGSYAGPAANGPMADGQQYTGAMPYSGDPQPYGPTQHGGTRQGGRLHGRGPLIPALAIGAVAAIVIVALVLVNHSPGSPSTTGSTGAAGASTTAGTPTGAAEQNAATRLNTLLSQSGKYRAEVNVALGDVLACKSLRPARDSFEASATNRRNLLTQLAALPDRSALPAALLQDLTTAWQASIKVDSDFRAWAQDEISGGCNPKKVTSDPNYQASNQYEGPASTSKARFAQAWKPIAAKYNLPAYTQFQI